MRPQVWNVSPEDALWAVYVSFPIGMQDEEDEDVDVIELDEDEDDVAYYPDGSVVVYDDGY